MMCWWPTNFFISNVTEAILEISHLLVLVNLYASTSAHKIRHAPLAPHASYFHCLNVRHYRCNFLPMASRSVSTPCFQQSMHRHYGENSSALWNKSIAHIHALLQFHAEWRTSEPSISTDSTIFFYPSAFKLSPNFYRTH